jgi:hypothetical protein
MSKKPNGKLLECLDCGKKFIFPIKAADGCECPSCGGRTVPGSDVYCGIDFAKGKDRTGYFKR